MVHTSARVSYADSIQQLLFLGRIVKDVCHVPYLNKRIVLNYDTSIMLSCLSYQLVKPTKTTRTAAYAAVLDSTSSSFSRNFDIIKPKTATKNVVATSPLYLEEENQFRLYRQ